MRRRRGLVPAVCLLVGATGCATGPSLEDRDAVTAAPGGTRRRGPRGGAWALAGARAAQVRA
ncbi:hypothetical protein ACFWVK_15260, partial [Streptomyces sp. NPDC058667]